MEIFKLVDECGVEDRVRIDETTTGLGVFAVRPYPATSVIGQITGELLRAATSATDYTFDLDDKLQLEPAAPFRYVNHSCDPNCEFDWMDDDPQDWTTRRLFLSAIRDIDTDEQFTIDYNWPAEYAIRCDCRSPLCRGWIVDPTDLAAVALDLTVSKREPTS